VQGHQISYVLPRTRYPLACTSKETMSSVVSLLPRLVLLVSLFAPPIGALLGLGLWVRSLRRAKRVPLFVLRSAYVVLALASVLVAVGLALATTAAVSRWPPAPYETGRMLGRTLGTALSFSIPGFWLAIVGLAWLAFWTWWSRRNVNRAGSRRQT
jgi:hypothetical protein